MVFFHNPSFPKRGERNKTKPWQKHKNLLERAQNLAERPENLPEKLSREAERLLENQLENLAEKAGDK